MPIVTLKCAKHPTPEQRVRLLERITTVIAEELGTPLETINVLIERVDPADWGVAGKGLDAILGKAVADD